MGPTSSWSFCRRVLALLGKRIPEAAPDPWHRPDSGAFPMHWTPLRPDEDPDVSNLPPLDYALHLLSTAKFYLGNLFAVIDESEFTRGIHELYEDPYAKARSNRTWFALFLLVLAFGKAFPSFGKSQRSPPGSAYALRAMAMLPDMSALYPDPVVAGQTLVLAALYFQSLDMRVAAYYHVGTHTGIHHAFHIADSVLQDQPCPPGLYCRGHAPPYAGAGRRSRVCETLRCRLLGCVCAGPGVFCAYRSTECHKR